MDEIKEITEDKLRNIAGERGFNLIYLEKDYFLTVLLFLIKDVSGIYFKGGTALNKIFLKHSRLSEDLDFSCKGSLSKVKNEIIEILNTNKPIFPKFKFENNTKTFFRMKIFYRSFFQEKNYIILDVNSKASIYLAIKKMNIPHFYNNIPNFEINVLSGKELVAEKVRAMITRNQPRDYFDVYMLLTNGYKLDNKLIKKKLKDVKEELDVERIFKNARKIYSFWDTDISQLTNKPVSYIKVIRKLQKIFHYKG